VDSAHERPLVSDSLASNAASLSDHIKKAVAHQHISNIWSGIRFARLVTESKTKNEPNKAMEPTPVAVTISAAQKVVPSTFVAHLGR
jgi:hypothetical protein